MKKILILSGLLIVVAAIIFLSWRAYSSLRGAERRSNPLVVASGSEAIYRSPSPISTPVSALAEPIAQFKERITKKPFGLYVTPQNSPVSPEKFTGFHTGADVEYEDVNTDVPVYALSDGTIVLGRTASGYGGVIVINFQLNGVEHTAVYGHIRPSSLPSIGQLVRKGDQIGLLGTGYSAETDGERKHLHFAILSDNRIDLKGYVQSQSELTGWLDPLSLYK